MKLKEKINKSEHAIELEFSRMLFKIFRWPACRREANRVFVCVWVSGFCMNQPCTLESTYILVQTIMSSYFWNSTLHPNELISNQNEYVEWVEERKFAHGSTNFACQYALADGMLYFRTSTKYYQLEANVYI